MAKTKSNSQNSSEDVEWITIENSDGDVHRWPTNTEPVADIEGNVNYMQPLSLTHGHAVQWRNIIGQRLAELLEYPDTENKRYVLSSWPADYKFYDHNKGNTHGKVRHDLYLVGSSNVARFRSPQEFIPHAVWLMTDPTLSRGNCKCKYCTKKPQRQISHAYGLSPSKRSQSLSPSRNPALRSNHDRERNRGRIGQNDNTVHNSALSTTVRRVPKPAVLPKGPKYFVTPERDKDLRAAVGPKAFGRPRWAREGELVWVKLEHPIAPNTKNDLDEMISFWPGFIKDINLKTRILPKETLDVHMKDITDSVGINQADANIDSEMPVDAEADADEDEDVPWTVYHQWTYKIRPIVVSTTISVEDDYILPYQAYAPCDKLLQNIHSVRVNVDKLASIGEGTSTGEAMTPEVKMSTVEERLFEHFAQFNPFVARVENGTSTSGDVGRNDEILWAQFEEAVGPFAAAIQIASRVAMYWTPTDQWEYKMLIPSGKVGRPASQPQDTDASATQIRFQGLWWGAERIWMGELVRLKPGRYQIAPSGAMIKKSSGPGKSNREAEKTSLVEDSVITSTLTRENAGSAETKNEYIVKHTSDVKGDPKTASTSTVDINGTGETADLKSGDVNGSISITENISMEALGAASRGVFLRLDGLFVVQIPSDDQGVMRNECRMCGMLYELADEDWESDVEEEQLKEPINNGIVSSGSASAGETETLASPVKGAALLAKLYNKVASDAQPDVLFAPHPDLLSTPPPAPENAMNTTEDSTIPTAQASTAVTTMTGLSEKAKGKLPATAPPTDTLHTSNPPSLSSPLDPHSTYPLAPPPANFKFRSILPDSHEATMPISFLSGRYYPSLLLSPLMLPFVETALQDPTSKASGALWALEGIVPGVCNAMDASLWRRGRWIMMREAESIARKELMDYWRSTLSSSM